MLDLSRLPAPLQEAGTRLWQQFEQAVAQQQLTPPMELSGDQISSEELSHQLTRAFVGSEYLAKTCIQQPQLLLDQISSGELFQPLPDSGYAALVEAAGACETDAELDKTLRRQRHRAMVRLIGRALARLAGSTETPADLSRVPDPAVQQAAGLHYHQLAGQYGRPGGKSSALAQPSVGLGMGKLGACELSRSPDIALIFTYPEHG